MTEPFNELTPSEAERLDLLQEECAEVIMAIAKIKRHGYNSFNPDDPDPGSTTNGHDLEKELGHVLNAFNIMRKAGDLDYMRIIAAQQKKAKTIGPYLHHQIGYEGYCGS